MHHAHKSSFKTSFSPNLHFVNDALRNDRQFCNISHKRGQFRAQNAIIDGKGCKRNAQCGMRNAELRNKGSLRSARVERGEWRVELRVAVLREIFSILKQKFGCESFFMIHLRGRRVAQRRALSEETGMSVLVVRDYSATR